ncbi:MAG: tetratricopeptide repeat protein, partial [Pirellulales bacterium]
IQGQPSDAVMHEFRALVLFAMKNYPQAAATIHAVLAVGPGWNWATLSSLYPSVEVYTPQLRDLEAYVRSNPNAANARFLLGYHYMTGGHPEAAAGRFREVIRLAPLDRLAGDLYRMVGGNNRQAVSADPMPSPNPNESVPPPPVPSQPVPTQTTTDRKPVDAGALVGKWHASRSDGSKFDLNLSQDKTFAWKFSQQQRGEDFSGTYMTEGALLILQRTNGGALVGQIGLDGTDRFRFKLLGAPADDAGLAFHR